MRLLLEASLRHASHTGFQRAASLLLGLCLVRAEPLAAQPSATPAERTAWLSTNMIRLAPLDRDDLRDLAPLADVLRNVDVVVLGEASHGDGGGHLARARVVRFLHEQLGFDVLAWEAGVYDAQRLDSLLGTGLPLAEVAPNGLYPWWGQSAQIRPLLEYVRRTKRSGRPMTAAGFDVQRRGPLVPMIDDIHRWLSRAGDPAIAAIRDSAIRALGPDSLTGQPRLTAEDRIEQSLHRQAPDLLRRFTAREAAARAALGATEAELAKRTLENLVAYAETVRLNQEPDSARRAASALEAYNLRERQNAANLVWLARERFPGRKIVVWTHNVHAVNGWFSPRFDGLSADSAAGFRDATGRRLKSQLGDRVYLTGTVSFDGEWGFPGRPASPIERPASGSLADLLHGVGAAHAVLDLRRAARSPQHWLNSPLSGTANAQTRAQYSIVWPRLFDGIVFVDRMTPSTPAPAR